MNLKQTTKITFLLASMAMLATPALAGSSDSPYGYRPQKPPVEIHLESIDNYQPVYSKPSPTPILRPPVASTAPMAPMDNSVESVVDMNISGVTPEPMAPSVDVNQYIMMHRTGKNLKPYKPAMREPQNIMPMSEAVPALPPTTLRPIRSGQVTLPPVMEGPLPPSLANAPTPVVKPTPPATEIVQKPVVGKPIVSTPVTQQSITEKAMAAAPEPVARQVPSPGPAPMLSPEAPVTPPPSKVMALSEQTKIKTPVAPLTNTSLAKTWMNDKAAEPTIAVQTPAPVSAPSAASTAPVAPSALTPSEEIVWQEPPAVAAETAPVATATPVSPPAPIAAETTAKEAAPTPAPSPATEQKKVPETKATAVAVNETPANTAPVWKKAEPAEKAPLSPAVSAAVQKALADEQVITVPPLPAVSVEAPTTVAPMTVEKTAKVEPTKPQEEPKAAPETKATQPPFALAPTPKEKTSDRMSEAGTDDATSIMGVPSDVKIASAKDDKFSTETPLDEALREVEKADAPVVPEETPAPPPATATAASEPAAEPQPEQIASAATTAAQAVPSHDEMCVMFDTKSSTLSAQAEQYLDNIAQQLNDLPETRIQLRAYADTIGGSESDARRMSLSRALMVRSYLADKGIKPARLDVRALGSKTTRSPNDRVDIIFLR